MGFAGLLGHSGLNARIRAAPILPECEIVHACFLHHIFNDPHCAN